jgi:hypothetical protein
LLIAQVPVDQQLAWALLTDSVSFSLIASGQLVTTAALDFEAQASYTLETRVTAVRADGLTASKAVTVLVRVGDVDEPPLAVATKFLMAENTAPGTWTQAGVQAEDPEGTPLQFSIGAAVDVPFAVHETDGRLRLSRALDFEAVRKYEFDVQVFDSTSDVPTVVPVVVQVTDVNEPPRLRASVLRVPENTITSSGQLVLLEAVDPEGHSVTFSTDSAPAGLGVTSTGWITADAALNYEAAARLQLEVKLSDELGAEYIQAVTINVLNNNDAPEVVPATITVSDQAVPGTQVGQVIGTDEDNGDLLSFAAQTANAYFRVDPRSGAIVSRMGLRGMPSQTLWVRAFDGQAWSAPASVVIAANVSNAAPKFVGAGHYNIEGKAVYDVTVAEGTPARSVFLIVEAADDDDDMLVYSLGYDSSGAAQISSDGSISFRHSGALNWEAKRAEFLNLTVADGDATAEAIVRIHVLDSREAPHLTAPATVEISAVEDGAIVAAATALDVDAASAGQLRFSLLSPSDMLSIDASSGIITVNAGGAAGHAWGSAPEFATVTVTDEVGLSDFASIRLVQANAARRSLAALGSLQQLEQRATVRADAAVGSTLTTLALPSDQARLVPVGSLYEEIGMNVNSLQLHGSVARYAGQDLHLYFRVQADGQDIAVMHVVLTVLTINQPPSLDKLRGAVLLVPENTGTQVNLATVRADDEAPAAVQFNVFSEVAEFQVVQGQLQLVRGALDAEALPLVELTLVAVDNHGLTDEAKVYLDVFSVNDAPELLLPQLLASSASNAGAFIGTVQVHDDDAADMHTYELLHGNCSHLAVTRSHAVQALSMPAEAAGHVMGVLASDAGTQAASMHISAVSSTGQRQALATIVTGQLFLQQCSDAATCAAGNHPAVSAQSSWSVRWASGLVTLVQQEIDVVAEASLHLLDVASIEVQLDSGERAAWDFLCLHSASLQLPLAIVRETGQVQVIDSLAAYAGQTLTPLLRVRDSGSPPLATAAILPVQVAKGASAPTWVSSADCSARTVACPRMPVDAQIGAVVVLGDELREHLQGAQHMGGTFSLGASPLTAGSKPTFTIRADTGDLVLTNDLPQEQRVQLEVWYTESGAAAPAAGMVDVLITPRAVGMQLARTEFVFRGKLVEGVALPSARLALASGESATFSLDSTAASSMVQVGSDGQLYIGPQDVLPTQVTDAQVPVMVRLEDGRFSRQQVTVHIVPANSAPVLSLLSEPFVVLESAKAGTLVGQPLRAFEIDAHQALAFHIAGGAARHFMIHPATGQLSVSVHADLASLAGTTALVTVTVTDNGAWPAPLQDSMPVEIFVQRINHAPKLLPARLSLPESATVGDHIGQLQAHDVDGDTEFKFMVVGGSHADLVSVDEVSGHLRYAGSTADLDYEAGDRVLELQVSVADALGDSSEHAVLVRVLDVNEHPVTPDHTVRVAEWTPLSTLRAGQRVGLPVPAYDPDEGDDLHMQLTQPHDMFELDDQGFLVLRGAALGEAGLDAERQSVHVVQYEAVDSAAHRRVGTITVEVLNVNEAPIATETGMEFAVPESAPAGSQVGPDLLAVFTDVDSESQLSVEIVSNGAAPVRMNAAGSRFVVQSPGFSYVQASTLVVYVVAVDGASADGLQSAPVRVVIRVERTPGGPTFLEGTHLSVDETAVPGTQVTGSIVVADGDIRHGDCMKYRIETQSYPGLFRIDSHTGKLSVATAGVLDAETTPEHWVVVQVEDAHVHSAQRQFTVVVNDVNEPAAFTQAMFDVVAATGSSSLGRLYASDAEQDAFTMQVDSSYSSSIAVAADGSLTRKSGANLDELVLHTFNVELVQNSEVVDTAAVRLRFVGSLPVFSFASLTGCSVPETAAPGTRICSAALQSEAVTFPEQYTAAILPVSANSLFTARVQSGQLVLLTSQAVDALDFEAIASYTLDVALVHAPTNARFTRSVLVAVQDMDDETPAFTSDRVVVSLPEDLAVGSEVARVSAVDPDAVSLVTYMLSGAPELSLQPGSNVVALAQPLDYETNPIIRAEVLAFDTAGHAATQVLELRVQDVNEAPSIAPGMYTVSEGAAAATVQPALRIADDSPADVSVRATGRVCRAGDDWQPASSSATIEHRDAGAVTFNAGPVSGSVQYSVGSMTIAWTDGAGSESMVHAVGSTEQSQVRLAVADEELVMDVLVAGQVVNTKRAAAPSASALRIVPGVGAELARICDAAEYPMTLARSSASTLMLSLEFGRDFEQVHQRELAVELELIDRRGSGSQELVIVPIQVVDVNEAPGATIVPRAPAQPCPAGSAALCVAVPENFAGAVASVILVDEEPDLLQASLDASGLPLNLARTAVPGKYDLVLTSALNYEGATQLEYAQLRLADAQFEVAARLEVRITDVVEPPRAVSKVIQVADQAMAGVVMASARELVLDEDVNDVLTFSMSSARAQACSGDGHFTIDASSGVIMRGCVGVVPAPLPLGMNTFTVFVSDSGANVVAVPVQLDVTSARVVITLKSATNVTQPENTAFEYVPRVEASSNVALTYALRDGPGFGVSACSGKVTSPASNFDFEADGGKMTGFTLVVTAATGDIAEFPVIVHVKNVNEVPAVSGAHVMQLRENLPAGTVVGQLSAVDPDGDALQVQIVDSNVFHVVPLGDNKYDITAARMLNHEAVPAHSITVRAMDGSGLKFDHTLIIHVQDVNEPPIAPNTLVKLPETTGAIPIQSGDLVTALRLSDPDGDVVTVRFAADSDFQDHFTLTSTGQLMFTAAGAAASNFENVAMRTRQLSLVAEDGSLSTAFTLSVELQDEPENPVLLAQFSPFSVPELAPAGTYVGSVRAFDVDAGDSLTFQLLTNAEGAFKIDETSGDLSTTAAGTQLLDYESGSRQLTVEISVLDSTGRQSPSQRFDINVLNVNEAPEFAVTSWRVSVPEDAAPGSAWQSLPAVDPEGDRIFATISPPAVAQQFEFDARLNLVVRAGAKLDAETQPIIDFSVTIADSGLQSSEVLAVAVQITDVNELPEQTAPIVAQIPENLNSTTVVADISNYVVDPEDAPLMYDGSAPFTEGWQLQVSVAGSVQLVCDGSCGRLPLDFELSLPVTVKEVANPTMVLRTSVRAVVVAANDPPTIVGASALALPEGSYQVGQSQALAQLSAVDPDPDAAPPVFSIVRDSAQMFSITSSGAISFKPRAPIVLDFELPPSPPITLRVRATDSEGAFTEREFFLDIQNVQEPPVLTSMAGQLTSLLVPEKARPGTVLAQLTYKDPEQDDVELVLERANLPGALAVFNHSLVLGTQAVLDFENLVGEQLFTAMLVLRDSTGLFTEVPVRVAVTDENDEPTLTSAAVSLTETASSALVHTMQFYDADAVDNVAARFTGQTCWQPEYLTDGTNTVSTQGSTHLYLGRTGQTSMSLHNHDGTVAFSASLVPDEYLALQMQLQMLKLSWTAGAVTLTRGSDILATSTGQFNVSSLHVSSSDVHAVASACGGVGAPRAPVLVMQPATGVVTAPNGLDYEVTPAFTLEVLVEDARRAQAHGTLSVSLTDVNEAPVWARRTLSLFIPESANSSMRYALPAVQDEDAGACGAVELTLADPSGLFELMFGALQLRGTARLNFEGDVTAAAMTVTASDGCGAQTELPVLVTVTDVNEPPAQLAPAAVVRLPEHTRPGTVLLPATAHLVDPEGSALAYSTTHPWLTVLADGSILASDAAVDVDFESAHAANLSVAHITAYDGVHSVTVQLAVQLTNVNEAPETTAVSSFNVSELFNSTWLPLDLSAAVTDQDADALLMWRLEGESVFELGCGAALHVRTGVELSVETQPVHDLMFTVCDEYRLCVPVPVTIELLDAPEPPVFVQASFEFSVPEHAEVGERVGQVLAIDPDVTSVVTYSVLGSTVFTVDSSGMLTVASELNFETVPTYNFSVSATDGQFTVSAPVLIRVLDENDEPTFAVDQQWQLDETTVLALASGTFRLRVEDEDLQQHAMGAAFASYHFELGRVPASVEGKFSVHPSSGLLYLTAAGAATLNFEDLPENPFTIGLRLVDTATAVAVNGSVQVEVRDVNEPPVCNGTAFQGLTVPETAQDRYVIADLSGACADPEGGALTMTVSDSASWLNMGSDKILRLARAGLDFEDRTKPRTVEGTLFVSDGVHTVNHGVAPVVLDVDEAPTVDVAALSCSVDELTGRGHVACTFPVLDPENRAVTANSGTAEFDAVHVSGNTFSLHTTSTPVDYETQPIVDVQITLSDGVNTQPVTIPVTVRNVNEPPILIPQPMVLSSVYDEVSVSLTSYLTDADCPTGRVCNDVHTWTLTDSANGTFALSQDGVLTVLDNSDVYTNNGPDYTGYSIWVRVQDAAGAMTGNTRFAISVEEANSPPRFEPRLPESVGLGEFAALGTVVANITVVDGGNDDVLVTLDSAQLTPFVVEPVPGQRYQHVLKLQRPEMIDYESEAMRTFSVQLKAADLYNVTEERMSTTGFITVHILDEPDPPVFAQPEVHVYLSEHAAAGQVAIDLAGSAQQLAASDADTPATDLTYTLSGSAADSGKVTLQAANGRVTLLSSLDKPFDYETDPREHRMTLRASDGTAGNDATCTVVLHVQNSNDAPVWQAPPAALSIPEDAILGTVVAQLVVHDADHDLVLFSLGSTFGGKFGLSRVNSTVPGQTAVNLTLTGGLDFESMTNYRLVISARDGPGKVVTHSIQLSVLDVPDVRVAAVKALVAGVEATRVPTHGRDVELVVRGANFGLSPVHPAYANTAEPQIALTFGSPSGQQYTASGCTRTANSNSEIRCTGVPAGAATVPTWAV